MEGLDSGLTLTICMSIAVFLLLFIAADPIFRFCVGDVYLGLTKKKRIDWRSRFTSTVHALVVCVLSTYALVAETHLREDPVWGESNLVMFMFALVTGYMIADIIVMVWNYSEIGELSFIYHHVLSAFTCGFVMIFRVFEYFALWRLLTEYSTPFLNLRVYLDDAGRRSSTLYTINGLLFTATFLLARIAALPHYYYVLYSVHGTAAFTLAGKLRALPYMSSFSMDILNMMWARKVVRGFLKSLSQRRSGTAMTAKAAQQVWHAEKAEKAN